MISLALLETIINTYTKNELTLMALHFTHTSFSRTRMTETALLTHFVGAFRICPRLRTRYASTFVVFLRDNEMVCAFTALVFVEGALHPTLHSVKFLLLAFGNSPTGYIDISKRILQTHLKCFVCNSNTCSGTILLKIKRSDKPDQPLLFRL